MKLETVQKGEFGDKPRLPTTLWEKSTTLKNAMTFVEDSTSMIVVLHRIFGHKSSPFSAQYKSSWHIKPI
jgi:hypothetical protein